VVEKRLAAEARLIQILFGLGAAGGLSDGELLARFVDRAGEPAELAFTVLVERHGPMVLRVCRSVLRDEHDAQDAFQATFLVLARRAASIQKRNSAASWLHGVALRVASSARASSARRRVHERQAAATRSTIASEEDVLIPTGVLHEELDRLPERYGVVLVLCHLEGASCEEAARRLNWPVGTVKSRLARGRERLRARLTRRGVAPSVVAGLELTVKEAPVVTLIEATVSSATGAAPPKVLSLATGFLRSMTMFKVGITAVSVLAVGLAVSILATLSRGAPGSPPPAGEGQAAQRSTKAEVDPKSSAQIRQIDLDISNSAPIYAVGDMDAAKVWVLVKKSGTWHTYKAPAGTKVRPFVPRNPHDSRIAKPRQDGDGNFVALDVEGDAITELAAFDPNTKAWVRQALREPVKGNIQPMLKDTYFALYPLGRYAYAFSAITGTWDSVDLGDGPSPRVEQLSVPGMAIAKGTGPLYSYDARTGRFRDVEADQE